MKADTATKPNSTSHALKDVARSMTFRCLACVVIYAVLVISLFTTAFSFSERKLDSAFPTMETIQKHEEALEQDRFEILKSALSNPSQVIIFDENGRTLYASNRYVIERISAQDLPIISANEDGRAYYEVFAQNDDRDEPQYTVLLCSTNKADNIETVKGYCVLDSDLNIEQGTLFHNRTSLTEREFSLIKGMFESKMYIEKLEYHTVDGEARTLVLVSPAMTEAAYDSALKQASKIWFAVIPTALVLTAVAILSIWRTIRNAVRPLDAAIQARREGALNDPNSTDLSLELRPTYESFVSLMNQLNESQAEKQRMIANISHDLKTPLTVIRGYAQAFEDGRVPEEKMTSYLHAINVKSQEANDLMDELFTFAKMEHPSFQPNMQRCDLMQVIRSIACDEQAGVEQAGCILAVSSDNSPAYVNVDVALLRRAIGNLVSNACKHNAEGTIVSISCSVQEKAAVVKVCDDGVGIPEELRRTMLEPFVTSNSARESGRGTGLGLSIASRCAQLNNTTLCLSEHPQPPFSTEFFMELPLAQAQEGEDANGPSPCPEEQAV